MQSLCGAFVNGVCVGDDGGCLLPNDRLKRLNCCFVRIPYFSLRTVARDGHRLRISRGINRSSGASFSRRGVLSKPRARIKSMMSRVNKSHSYRLGLSDGCEMDARCLQQETASRGLR